MRSLLRLPLGDRLELSRKIPNPELQRPTDSGYEFVEVNEEKTRKVHQKAQLAFLESLSVRAPITLQKESSQRRRDT